MPVVLFDPGRPLTIELEPVSIAMDEVTVTADSYAIWKDAEEISQITLSPKQIAVLPSLGEIDVFRSLQLLPGISASNDGSSGLYVRGGTPDQNLVLYDGMRVYHVDHFFGFFSAFNADAIKDIQVYKGGFGAEYGGRLSSVLELTGKSGNMSETSVGLGANLLSVNGYLEVPLFDKGSFLLAARRSYSDVIESALFNSLYDELASDETAVQQQSGGPGGMGGGMRRGFSTETIRPEFYFYDVNAKLSWMPDRGNSFALSFYMGRDNLNDSQELGDLRFRGSEGEQEDVFGTRLREAITDWGNTGASFRWSRQWSDRVNSTLLLSGTQYFSTYDRNQQFLTDDQGTGIDDSLRVFRGGGAFASEEDNGIDDLTVRFDMEHLLSERHTLKYGLWVSHMATEYNATLNDTLSLFSRNSEAQEFSLFLQDRWKATNALTVTAGLRGTLFSEQDGVYVEPRLSARYQLSDELSLQGAWGMYNQFIHRITTENVLEGSRDFWLVADDDFKPASSTHSIAGISYKENGYLFQVEGYYKTLDDLIDYSRRFQTRADYGELFFFGDGISRGVEFLAQKQTGHLNGWLSYTLSEVEYTFPGLNDGEAFPANHDKTHEFKSVFTYSLGKWDFSATWLYSTGQPATVPESQYYLDMLDGDVRSYIHVGDRNTTRLPDYHRLDVSISRHWYPSTGNKDAWHLQIGLSVFNLYNRSNVWYRSYDLDVSPIVITDVTMLGITPTVFAKLRL